MKKSDTDVLIVGGGVGGSAAALAVTTLGKRAILTEETDWLGGQLTTQAVPPDEHRWIEHFGCTRSYRQFRNLVRQFYKDHYPLTSVARSNPQLNPGKGNVSRLCHEPKIAVAVLDQMMAYAIASGKLQIKRYLKPISVETYGDYISAVTFQHTQTNLTQTFTSDYVLDATELGDLLPMSGTEYVSGAESHKETSEPHALEGHADPEDIQAITWCMAISHDQNGSHTINQPSQYSQWRDYVPQLHPTWSGKMLSWTYPQPTTLEPIHRVLLPEESDDPWTSLWTYRRLICRDHYPTEIMPHEVTLVNWPQNDYLEGNIIDKTPDLVDMYRHQARQLSLSLLYWMQVEAPRPDGGVGYPGLYLRPDITGTDDGLAKMPYIRESRRIRAEFTVTENHVGTDARNGACAEKFDDSVGIGCYRIDLHPSTSGRNYIDISSLPFQIPLGAMIPIRLENLIPANKNIGTTHITNGCYRLHPVEWNIGESAGMLAAFCLAHQLKPRQVRNQHKYLRSFQNLLQSHGVELEWPQTSSV